MEKRKNVPAWKRRGMTFLLYMGFTGIMIAAVVGLLGAMELFRAGAEDLLTRAGVLAESRQPIVTIVMFIPPVLGAAIFGTILHWND